MQALYNGIVQHRFVDERDEGNEELKKIINIKRENPRSNMNTSNSSHKHL